MSRFSAFTTLQRVKISTVVFNNFHVTTLTVTFLYHFPFDRQFLLPVHVNATGGTFFYFFLFFFSFSFSFFFFCKPQAALSNFSYTQVSPHVQKKYQSFT